MEKEHAMDFYLFSVLGKGGSDSKDRLIEAAIDRAYRDASSRVSYCANDEERQAKAKILEKRIYMLSDDDEDFAKWHKGTCKVILPEKPDEGDGYGKAQKWLNMTMKYLATINALVSSKNTDYADFYKSLVDLEGFFHIPVDSFIIQALCYLEKEPVKRDSTGARSLPYKDKKELPVRKAVADCSNPHDYVKAWSTWEESDYDGFREKLDARFNLEWESKVWPMVAAYRNAIGSKSGSDKDKMEEANKLRSNLRDKILTASPWVSVEK